MKSDLNAMFFNEFGDHLSVPVTNHDMCYQAFRDFAACTCWQLLLRKTRLLVQHVDEAPAAYEDGGHDEAEDEEDQPGLDTVDGLIAALTTWRRIMF